MRIRSICLIILLVFAGTLLTSCRSSEYKNTFGDELPSEMPKYGATLNLLFLADVNTVFDPGAQGQFMGYAGMLISDQLLGEDWTKGPAGTGEVTWTPNLRPIPDTSMGILAESWEIPESGTVVFTIRRGVHWALNPDNEASLLMNGREVTADDWIGSFNHLVQHPNSIFKNYMPQVAAVTTMEKTDSWEVTLKTPGNALAGWSWLACGSSFHYLLPPEVIEKYGDMSDWHNVVGTGPFMLNNLVPGSSATLVRNPKYWGKDPAGPGKGNRLPYLDGIKILDIPDISTADAAFRTGKVDVLFPIPAESAGVYIQNTPDLEYRKYLPSPTVISIRTDNDELPFTDKKVRQALMTAIDYNALKDDYYKGEAEILAFPVTSENMRVYVPLEEMPDEIQSLFDHNTDSARQILTEAGYPDGFEMSMIFWDNYGFTDLAAILKAMWAEVGIELELKPLEAAHYMSTLYSGSWEESLIFPFGSGAYPECLSLPFHDNSDPVIANARLALQDQSIINMPEADRIYRELVPYILSQAYHIPLPSVYSYSLWWPWLKNYYGETPIRLFMYSWIDQDLKEKMAGSK